MPESPDGDAMLTLQDKDMETLSCASSGATSLCLKGEPNPFTCDVVDCLLTFGGKVVGGFERADILSLAGWRAEGLATVAPPGSVLGTAGSMFIAEFDGAASAADVGNISAGPGMATTCTGCSGGTVECGRGGTAAGTACTADKVWAGVSRSVVWKLRALMTRGGSALAVSTSACLGSTLPLPGLPLRSGAIRKGGHSLRPLLLPIP
jgi:hypothetical protein